MTLTTNAYGTSAKVATMSRYKTTSGDFDTTTNPTKDSVEYFINMVSGLVNGYLKAKGFSVPLSNADNVFAVEGIVIPTVAALIDAEVRGTGRYAPNNKAIAARGQLSVLVEDIKAAIDMLADGFDEDETRSDRGGRPSSVGVVKVDYAIDTN
jgi:hypothetical protein